MYLQLLPGITDNTPEMDLLRQMFPPYMQMMHELDIAGHIAGLEAGIRGEGAT